MKRFAFFVISALLFVSGISAFAYGKPVSANNMSSGPSIAAVNEDLTALWAGKTADQLIQKMGNPSSIFAADGEKIYAYDQSIPRDGRAPERTLRLEFYVASDGSITSGTSARF